MYKKSMYKSDIQWYDQSIYNAIVKLDEKYPNAIPVFGGALGAYNYIKSDKPDFAKFAMCLPEVAQSARFYTWHEGVTGALRRFCHICHVDPHLVELYLGTTFEQLVEE